MTHPEDAAPGCSRDLSERNRSRVILDAVGPRLLREIGRDGLDLLGTSCLIYERNGDYALGMFATGWCRFLVDASRRLCESEDDQAALRSGLWRCHESCWKDAALVSIEREEAVDCPCSGGLLIYAVPIRAGDEVVGAICLGHGDPPRDAGSVREIARNYGVGEDELRARVEATDPRPPEVVEHAKRRLRTSARLIGEIVSRARAEAALRRERDRAQSYLDLAMMIFVALDAEGRIRLLNPRGCEVLECTQTEALGADWFESFVPEAARVTVRDTFQKIMAGESRLYEYFENPVMTRSGRERCVAWHNRLLYDDEGNISGTLSCGEDVTERVEAEQAVRDEKAFIDAALDAQSDTFFLFDAATGRALRWNRAFREVSGYTDDEIASMKAPEAWYDEEDLARARRAIEGSISGGKATVELALVTRSGDRIPFEYSAAVLQGGEGPHRHVIAIGRDVRARYAAEAERRHLEEQIQHAQKLESLGVLAGGIAHDFNNLLTGVMGHASLARMKLEATSPVLSSLEQIQRAAERASDLCRQMLAYSGKGRFVVEAIDLSSLVDEMLQMLQVSITKKAELRLDLGREGTTIEADATQVRQVVMNLITNASEALGERGGLIRLRTGHRRCEGEDFADRLLGECLSPGSYVFLQVTDDGRGMDDETRSRLFDPFYTTKQSGRGLGLAAVLGIVRGHGGAIRVASEPGSGTTFEVLFPASSRRVETPAPRAPVPEGRRGSGTILVVDDDEVVRNLASRSLEMAGFTVLLAVDGLSGVERYRENADDVRAVLLDLTMPGLDGEQVYRELCRIRPDVRVILSSGYDREAATSRLTGAGVAAFLQKPYGPATLLDLLFGVLGEA